MSNGFSWNKILGGNGEATAAEAPATPPVAETPVAAPPVATAPPVAAAPPPVTEPPVAPEVSAPIFATPPAPEADLPFGGFDSKSMDEKGFNAPEEVTAPPASSGPSSNDELREILARIRGQEAEPASSPVQAAAPEESEAQFEAPAASAPAFNGDQESVTATEPPSQEWNTLPPAKDWEEDDIAPAAFSRVEVVQSGLGDAQLAQSDDPLNSIFAAPPVVADGPPPAAPPFAQTSEAAKLNPPPAAPPRSTPEAAFEFADEDEDADWSKPIAAPEPPKVSPSLVSPLPGEEAAAPADPILEEVERAQQNELIKGSVPQNLNPVEPPSLVPPMMVPPPVAAPAPQALSTPDADLTSFKAAAKDAGLPTVADVHIDDILRVGVERKASDIHLTVGLPPMARIDGEVVPLPWAPVTPEDSRRLMYEILNDDQLEKFERTHELDFGHTVPGVGRFRFNAYMQRGSVAGAMRTIPNKIPEFDSLGLPNIIRDMAKRTSGLVLVTGPTGSGKSTTIATMIDDINRRMKGHIMTIEDPIEYMHQHRNCMVNQRELHSDTYSFHNALRAVLREDPDIILVGELRDLETIEAALTLAETGHLVFGTLHTRNCPSTIDRIIDVFPKDAQEQIRVLLSNTIEGVVSQQLLPALGGGRRAAIEIMLATPAIKNLIREGKTHQMYSVLETSGNLGMQTMDAQLAELYRAGTCDYEECLIRSIDKETFARLAKRA